MLTYLVLAVGSWQLVVGTDTSGDSFPLPSDSSIKESIKESRIATVNRFRELDVKCRTAFLSFCSAAVVCGVRSVVWQQHARFLLVLSSLVFSSLLFSSLLFSSLLFSSLLFSCERAAGSLTTINTLTSFLPSSFFLLPLSRSLLLLLAQARRISFFSFLDLVVSFLFSSS